MIGTVAVLGGVLAWVAPAQALLKVGDAAPPFGKKIEWVKGSAVDPAKGGGNEIYLVEFWATWCGPCIAQIPHTNELQQKYEKQGLRVVALTSPGQQQQRLDDVKRFVQAQGDKMNYTIGFDRTEDTATNYMLAAGANGIPYAFVIGKDGKIAWQGYLPDPQMDRVVEQVIAGKFDAAAAKAAAETSKKLEGFVVQFNRAAMMRQWEDALKALNGMLQIDGANKDGIQFSLQILSNELQDPARVRAWVQAYLKEHKDSAAGLAMVASSLLRMPELSDRHPDLALDVAVAACAADERSVDALQARAQALHQIGKIDQALEWQEKAVALADKSNETALRRTLEFYRTCKQLGER